MEWLSKIDHAFGQAFEQVPTEEHNEAALVEEEDQFLNSYQQQYEADDLDEKLNTALLSQNEDFNLTSQQQEPAVVRTKYLPGLVKKQLSPDAKRSSDSFFDEDDEEDEEAEENVKNGDDFPHDKKAIHVSSASTFKTTTFTKNATKNAPVVKRTNQPGHLKRRPLPPSSSDEDEESDNEREEQGDRVSLLKQHEVLDGPNTNPSLESKKRVITLAKVTQQQQQKMTFMQPLLQNESESIMETTIRTSNIAAFHTSTTSPSSTSHPAATPLEKDNMQQTEVDLDLDDFFESTQQSKKKINDGQIVSAIHLAGQVKDSRIRTSSLSSGSFKSDGAGPALGTGESSVSGTRSLPQHVEFRSDFHVDDDELYPDWRVTNSLPFDARLNRYGVVHVKILAVQRLECSAGSHVQGIVSLIPWKGQVRAKSAVSFPGPSSARSGVCVRWDEDTTEPVSMVHAYSSEDSPVPSIHVRMVCSPLGSSLFEFTLCQLTLSCAPLMQSPNTPRRQWFTTTASGRHVSKAPIVQIEAMFQTNDEDDEDDEDDDDGSGVHQIDENDKVADRSDAGNDSFGDLAFVDEFGPLPTQNSKASWKIDDGSVSVQSKGTLSAAHNKSLPTNPHLLRLKSHWTPAACCVCKRNIMAGRLLLSGADSYHCESCGIDCCGDCRVNVDIRLPCGSELAIKARDSAVQSNLTVDKILQVVAPVDQETAKKIQDSNHGFRDFSTNDFTERTDFDLLDSWDEENRIGVMKLEFAGAAVFDLVLPAHANIPDLRKREGGIKLKSGDYYIRVSWTGGRNTKRTRTVQNSGRPKFSAAQEMRFNVPHYGTEFRIELIDATTDKVVGRTLLTTQSILQLQRDSTVEHSALALQKIWKGPEPSMKKQNIVLELRGGLKNGFSSEFFAPGNAESSTGDSMNPGDVVGLVELTAVLEEDTARLFGKTPFECPPRPPDELNLATFQIHIARLGSFIDDVRQVIAGYNYIVSWENPMLTLTSFVFFLRFWMRFDPSYILSAPFFFFALWMLYLSHSRGRGRLRRRLLRKVLEDLRKKEKVSVDYAVHRPAGLVTMNVEQGRWLRSDIGLPGNVRCRVSWDPTRFASDKERKKISSIDKATGASHLIGISSFVYSINPTWDKWEESDGTKRLKQLLPSSAEGDFFDTNGVTSGLSFPILQPLRIEKDGFPTLQDWKECQGAIIFDVKFQDTLNLIPGSDYSLGEVVIPLSRLVHKGTISGWFEVISSGATKGFNGSCDFDDSRGNFDVCSSNPEIYLTLTWNPPPAPSADRASETEKEASHAIQEELIRSALIASDRKPGLVDSSLSTMRGISDTLLFVQNTLGSLLDQIGAIKNAFNFSDPFKSTVVFTVIILLWIFFSLVPIKALIFVGGMAQYVSTLVSRCAKILEQRKVKPSPEAAPPENQLASPVSIWISNALQGLPTDEDLRKTYFWECRSLAAREMEAQAEAKRKSRLQSLWRAQWYSIVYLLRAGKSNKFERQKVFAMIQGHRFLWWRSISDFDSGCEPSGRIFLAGHAGIATPSPLELREVTTDEVARLTSIFGKGLEKQEKMTILTPSNDVREKLEDAVLAATATKKD